MNDILYGEGTLSKKYVIAYSVHLKPYKGYPCILRYMNNYDKKEYATYCADRPVGGSTSVAYYVYNISNLTWVPAYQQNIINSILLNSYPYITLDEVRRRSGVNLADEKEAISATTMAIYYYTNDATGEWLDLDKEYMARIKALRDWYLTLPGKSTKTELAYVSFKSEKVDDILNIYYKVIGENYNGTKPEETFKFTPEVAYTELPEIDGYKYIQVKSPPNNLEIQFNIKQKLSESLVYIPVDGREKSQSMVGPVFNEVELTPKYVFQSGSLIIKKTDDDKNKLSGAKFNVYSKSLNYDLVYKDVTTDETGTATINNMIEDEYKIVETQAPDGYENSYQTQYVTVKKDTTSTVTFIDVKSTPVPTEKDRCQAITDLIESVALEQTALSHILNAEGEKIQKVLTIATSNSQVIQTNQSVEDMVNTINNLESILQSKLQLFEDCLSCEDCE